MSQSNDYSFAPNSTYAGWNKIGVHTSGVLLAGQEPAPPSIVP